MCVCLSLTHIHTHTHTHKHILKHAHTRTHTCISEYIHFHIIHMYTCTHTHAYARVHTHACVPAFTLRAFTQPHAYMPRTNLLQQDLHTYKQTQQTQQNQPNLVSVCNQIWKPTSPTYRTTLHHRSLQPNTKSKKQKAKSKKQNGSWCGRDAKLIVNFSHESDFMFLRTPFFHLQLCST